MDYVFFFNDTATTEIYTLSLHDALPICPRGKNFRRRRVRSKFDPVTLTRRCNRGYSGKVVARRLGGIYDARRSDRKSTRLNSSHANISYAVFCLKKKK